MNPPKHAPVAIIYDFDGTLAPGNMQDHQFIPDVGMKPKEFWTEVDRLSKEHQADGILMYMYYMLRKAAESGVPVRLSDFRELGQKVTLFEGVTYLVRSAQCVRGQPGCPRGALLDIVRQR